MTGSPPKKIVKRMLRGRTDPRRSLAALARYGMNDSTQETRSRFLDKASTAMENFRDGQNTFAAVTSTSTRNSARVMPPTTISVETGFGSSV